MTSFYSEAELASDTYRILTGAKTLREFIVVAASIVGELCDKLIPLEEIAEYKNAQVHDYESLCDWISEQPVRPNAQEHWTYYWDKAANIFHDYERQTMLDDWELYLEMVDPLNPGWDVRVDDKEQCVRDRITEICFTITRWVKGSSEKCLSSEA